MAKSCSVGLEDCFFLGRGPLEHLQSALSGRYCGRQRMPRIAHDAVMGGDIGWWRTHGLRPQNGCKCGCSTISRLLTRPSRNPAPYVGHELNGGLGSTTDTSAETASPALSWSFAMMNWPEVLRHAEEWAEGFWTGAASASLMLIAGAAFVVLVRAM